MKIKDPLYMLPEGKVELKLSILSGLRILCHKYYLITTSERNQEAALCPQELTLALLSQRLSQVHLSGSTSPDYQSLPQFLSICKSS